MTSSRSVEHFEIQRRREAIPSQWEARRSVFQVSASRGMNSTFLEKIVFSLENILSTMDVCFQRIEHAKETLEAHFEEARSQPANIREKIKTDILKPKEFKGVTDLIRWRTSYGKWRGTLFEGQGVVEEYTKVCTTALYLFDNATLWWRRKCVDMEMGHQPWANQELQRRNVKDVDEDIIVAESLTEYHRGNSKTNSSCKPNSTKGGEGGGKNFSTKKEGKYTS
ncbi:hypothetical protein PIB30_026791 [Stylosanthes scabra]|uniref:Uncharacterized protein n=1 Tax=Stylosanthes scabra TaxID=79078 RepID=A0ABU6Z868_9FABA|nr:hypothetical protein [Stylosanthes scabra]